MWPQNLQSDHENKACPFSIRSDYFPVSLSSRVGPSASGIPSLVPQRPSIKLYQFYPHPKHIYPSLLHSMAAAPNRMTSRVFWGPAWLRVPTGCLATPFPFCPVADRTFCCGRTSACESLSLSCYHSLPSLACQTIGRCMILNIERAARRARSRGRQYEGQGLSPLETPIQCIQC